MERTYENGLSNIKRNKLEDLYTKAYYKGTFGEKLAELNRAELCELKTIIDECLMSEIEEWAPGMIIGIAMSIRQKLSRLVGKNYDPAPENIRTIRRLQKELRLAMGEYKPEEAASVKPDNYMEDFLAFLNSLTEKEKGPNATHLKIRAYVKIGPEQEVPAYNEDAKVVISYKLSFEENLAFIKEHINYATSQNNLRLTDLKLQREREKY